MSPYAFVPGSDDGARDVERAREQQNYARATSERKRNEDPRLRSCKAVVGYDIHATDGDIGHVEGMLVDGTQAADRTAVDHCSGLVRPKRIG